MSVSPACSIQKHNPTFGVLTIAVTLLVLDLIIPYLHVDTVTNAQPAAFWLQVLSVIVCIVMAHYFAFITNLNLGSCRELKVHVSQNGPDVSICQVRKTRHLNFTKAFIQLNRINITTCYHHRRVSYPPH